MTFRNVSPDDGGRPRSVRQALAEEAQEVASTAADAASARIQQRLLGVRDLKVDWQRGGVFLFFGKRKFNSNKRLLLA